MNGRYILDDNGNPVPCHDLMNWARWMEDKHRVIEQTHLPNGLMVSTVFLGLDHNFHGGPPLLFETMVFDRPTLDRGERGAALDYQERYTSKHDALVGHAKACEMFRGSVPAGDMPS